MMVSHGRGRGPPNAAAPRFSGYSAAVRPLNGQQRSMKRPDFDRRTAGDGGFTAPGDGVVEIGDVQHPETADVLLTLDIRAVRHRRVAAGPRADRFRRAHWLQSPDENPDTGR